MIIFGMIIETSDGIRQSMATNALAVVGLCVCQLCLQLRQHVLASRLLTGTQKYITSQESLQQEDLIT